MCEKEVWSYTWFFTFDLRTSETTISASLAAKEILDSDLRKKLFSNAQIVSFSIDSTLSTVSTRGNDVLGSSVTSGESDYRGDVAIHGFGGCPMAKDDLTGNLATEDLEQYFNTNKIDLNLNTDLLYKAYLESWDVFNKYH